MKHLILIFICIATYVGAQTNKPHKSLLKATDILYCATLSDTAQFGMYVRKKGFVPKSGNASSIKSYTSNQDIEISMLVVDSLDQNTFTYRTPSAKIAHRQAFNFWKQGFIYDKASRIARRRNNKLLHSKSSSNRPTKFAYRMINLTEPQYYITIATDVTTQQYTITVNYTAIYIVEIIAN
jgi:hypothetical protein